MALLLPDTLEFLRELELNNDRTWFEANKKRYEASVKKPFEDLAGVLIERMKEIDPAISMLPRQAVSRIYRDVRFSKDKSPYKPYMHIAVSRREQRNQGEAGLYLHIGTRTMGIATGYYMLEPPMIKAMREFLAANPEEFEKQLGNTSFKEHFGTIAGERNKIIPPELREAAKRQPLIFNKQFYYWKEADAEEALRDDLPDFVMEHIRAAQPMNAFLARAFS